MIPTSVTFPSRKILKEGNLHLFHGLNVLVGGNGSGKSSLLESLYIKNIADRDYKILVFSSGQNQNFSDVHNEFLLSLRKELNAGAEIQTHSFYFDITWAPILLTLAAYFKNTSKVSDESGNATFTTKGLCSKFLLDNKYSLENLWFDMEVPQFYFSILENNQEFISSDFVQIVDTLFEIDSANKGKQQKKKKISVENIYAGNLNEAISPTISNKLYFSIEKLLDQIQHGTKLEKIIKLLSFFQIASIDNSYIDMQSLSSTLKKETNFIKYGELSDGEYQLLSCYAILDIFSDYYDCIILDEVDSHIHVSNLIPLWKSLNLTTKTHLITSTHSPISLKYVSPERVISLNGGKCESGLGTLSQLQKIFDSNQSSKKTVALSFKNSDTLVLIDGLKDWQILRTLFKKVKGESFSPIFDKIRPYPLSSTRQPLEPFDDKDKFVKLLEDVYKSEFSDEELNEITLNKIICIKDRDDENLAGRYKNKDGLILVKEEHQISFTQRKKIKVITVFLNRREIENYLICPQLLKDLSDDTLIGLDASGEKLFSKEVKSKFNNEEAVATINCKDFVTSLISNLDEDSGPQGFNFSKLESTVKEIPTEQISHYISLMHDYLAKSLS